MANISKIEKHGLGKTVLELSLQHTIAEIITILHNEHDLDVGYKTVQRYIEGYRQERREQTRAVINEQVKEHVPDVLGRLSKVIERLDRRLDNADTDRDAAALAGPLLKAIDMQLDISGAKKEEVTVNVNGSSEWREHLRRRTTPEPTAE